jgi:uncharacterized protein YbjQ (UPF0145 family)
VIAPESVVTFEGAEGFRIVRSFGRARGEAARPASLLRATFRTIAELVGLSAPEFRGEAERARAECLESLLAGAERLGANGVLGLQFEALETEDGTTVVSAVGEAVLLEPIGNDA